MKDDDIIFGQNFFLIFFKTRFLSCSIVWLVWKNRVSEKKEKKTRYAVSRYAVTRYAVIGFTNNPYLRRC